MNKILTLVLLAAISLPVKAIPIGEADRLFTTCKVWGFLKYYHPAVANGKFDWDQQLFSFLDKTKAVTSKEELSRHYLDWIESLGTVKKCPSCGKPSKEKIFDRNFDLSWTQDPMLFTAEVSLKLKYIEDNRHMGPSHYAVRDKYAIFGEAHEKQYADEAWMEPHIRLLTLFRFWNQFEYFAPNKYLTDTKWDDVLRELIPEFQKISSYYEYYRALRRLMATTDDSHAILHQRKISGDTFYPPLFTRIIEGKAVVEFVTDDVLAAESDIRVGDIVEAVDGKTLEAFLDREMPLITGSNRGVKLRNSSYFLYGKSATVTVVVERDGKRMEKTMKRYLPKEIKNFYFPRQPATKILEGGIAYLDLNQLQFDIKGNDRMMAELTQYKALIIDLRKGSNVNVSMIARHLIGGKPDFVQFIVPDFDYPGRFLYGKQNSIGVSGDDIYRGKILLLVDEETQSSGEYATMALQTAANAITIGSQTAGADGASVTTTFPAACDGRFTGAGILYPDGSETQRKGVRVDIEVKPTIKGIREGRDEVLEKALEIAR